jgi:hypothetical protein
VRTLSTGVVHPLVVGHSGCFKLWEGYRPSNNFFNLCVRGDYAAASTLRSFISIWNWKTGVLVPDQVRDHVILDISFSYFALEFLKDFH